MLGSFLPRRKQQGASELGTLHDTLCSGQDIVRLEKILEHTQNKSETAFPSTCLMLDDETYQNINTN